MTIVNKTPHNSWRNRLIPIIIFAMGIIPLFIGLFLYHNPDYLSGSTIERGELLDPPLDMRPWLGQPGKWQIMLLASDECLEECERMFYYGRQVHEALKEERQVRVERVLFVENSVELTSYQLEGLAAQLPKVTIYRISASELDKLFAPYLNSLSGSDENWRDLHNSIFVVDPNANLMLRHQPINTVKQAKSLLKDLNLLLRISRIG